MGPNEQRLRAFLPDTVVDGSPMLFKACKMLRLTYEIRLATYFARKAGEILILQVREDCELSENLKSFTSEHRVLVRRR
jgi:hypothetical protein